ncbi:MAG: hypothetical protein ACM3SY_02860 [Candidatus Omnitrophota bacterium]
MSGKLSDPKVGLIPVSVLTVLLIMFGLFSFQVKAEDQSSDEKEIIRVSRLDTKPETVTVKRDIFSPEELLPQSKTSVPFPVKPSTLRDGQTEENAKPVEESIEDQVRRSIVFEGYVIRNSKSHALVNINSEFIIVGVDDVVMGKVKIKKINRKSLTVEADAKTFEIKLKGENENE